ncbi:endospore germination permease [Paenibacillus rhizovicinus]|uniref:Endospore germination permease n=1 Tax=Paenibacillus rhizovicinus TaxID=2704463 RepID=A0A6C0NU11_9BACL|nr:endospore germination permease [Paenibacillus rhizovicinus]QHW29611.1 endospore germination permease [Paenibacillus rhizovicinus]
MKIPPIEKISGTQLGLILFTFVVSTINLTVPGEMVMYAKHDAWLSVLPAALLGLLTVWVMTTLSRRYPGLTIVEYGSKILGKWFGTLLGLNFIYYWYVSISTITFQHTAFISTLLLPNSPSIVGCTTLLVLCAMTATAGIEVIGRCNQFLTPLLIVAILPIFMLTIKDANPAFLQPVLGDGLKPVLKGAYMPASAYMNQLYILGWLLPYLNHQKEDRKASLFALAGITGTVFFIVMLSIMVLGPLTGKLTYSFLSVIQYVGVEGSFERLEAIAVSIWVMGYFVKVSIALFILCLTVGQVFGIQNHRDLMVPVILLTVVGSIWIFKNGSELLDYLVFTFPLLALLNQTFIPILLLVIDTVRRRFTPSRT